MLESARWRVPIPLVGSRPPKGQVSEQRVRDLVYSSNERVHSVFHERHGELVDRAISGITLAHDYLDLFRSRAPREQKSAILELLFHASINAVLCATHHLISGYPWSSGNMLRQHTEAIAMTLLCLDPESGVLAEFARSPSTYPVHKAPDKLRQRKRSQRLKALIGFDEQAWAKVLELTELYDSLSHASGLSLAHTQMLGTENEAILGGEYDPFKAESYERDLRRCATAAEAFAQLMSAIVASLYPEAHA